MTPSETASPSATTAAGLPKDHSVCVVIPAKVAAEILGASPTVLKVPDTSTAERVHIDRCTYQSAKGNLGYQLDRFSGALTPALVVKGTTGELKARPGVQEVTLGLGSESVGFTIAIGARSMGRGYVAVSDTIGVDVIVTADSPAAAKKALIDVATRLVRAAS